MSMIIGIDPGLTGAVAVIKSDKVILIDTPICEVKKGKKNHKEYLAAMMATILRRCNGAECFIESVHAMPGQGVTSMFNFGKGFGLWLGILAALNLPYTLVTPQAWKKILMQGIADKDAARLRAQELYPSCAEELRLKKHIGRADALLIAHYGKITTTKII